jgi:hypothetical protein
MNDALGALLGRAVRAYEADRRSCFSGTLSEAEAGHFLVTPDEPNAAAVRLDREQIESGIVRVEPVDS